MAINIRIVTLRYSESLGGFPEDPLRQVLAGGNLIEQREYFFTHGGVPHLALVLLLDSNATGPVGGRASSRDREDPGDKLPEHLQPLYRSLRQWRNDRAKQDGVPAYAIMRNVQVAEICRALPRTLEALKQIEGIGEATVSKYGRDIVGQIPPDLQPEPPTQPAPEPAAEPAPKSAPKPSPNKERPA
ncbi:HRDC domain-containing protein [bacterium]|nr:HRDC domain-containing protein [bacterium]